MVENEKCQEKCAYYVSLGTDGVPIKVESDDISEIIGKLKEDALEWLDFSVENINEDCYFIASSLKFSLQLIASVLSNRLSAYEDLETELGLMVPAVRVEKFEVNVYPLIILIRKNLIVTIHPKEVIRLQKIYRYANIFMKKIRQDIPWNDKLTILLTRILDENNEINFSGLRLIEDEGDELGKYIIDLKTDREQIGKDIYKMKHALTTYLDTLWASWEVINSLRYGDAETISDNPKLLQRIGILGDDISRQIALGEHMSQVLVSGFEVFQTIHNNQLQILNDRLSSAVTWLAILITAVMVPNTIATILNISKISENLDPLWVYFWIISPTVFATIIMYYLIKQKKWLTSKT
ncbi:MAG: CorA family divalent cation transporter [Candidatus Thermoplasmatota archaeon]|jgi:magnesium transporter|nr:CorA family divalent cation transporter [Candidatus Thermoplasmatota archaeon]